MVPNCGRKMVPRRTQMPKSTQRLYTMEELKATQPRFGEAPTHISTWDVARLLAYIEWSQGTFGFCPCCKNTFAEGHASDCLLNKLLRESWKEHPGRLDQSWLDNSDPKRETE